MLFKQLGPSSLVATAVLVLMMPLQVRLLNPPCSYSFVQLSQLHPISTRLPALFRAWGAEYRADCQCRNLQAVMVRISAQLLRKALQSTDGTCQAGGRDSEWH